MPRWMPPSFSPAIYFDLFPSTVLLPSQTYTGCRIVLTAPGAPGAPGAPRLYVFRDTNTGPDAIIIAEYDLASLRGSTKTGFDLTVTAPLSPAAEPFTVQVRPESGCGCGLQVKTITPFSTMRHTAAPPLPPLPLPAP